MVEPAVLADNVNVVVGMVCVKPPGSRMPPAKFTVLELAMVLAAPSVSEVNFIGLLLPRIELPL